MRQLTVPDNNLMDLLSDNSLLTEDLDSAQVHFGKELIKRANEWINQATDSACTSEISTAVNIALDEVRQRVSTEAINLIHFDLKVIETISPKLPDNAALLKVVNHEIARYTHQIEGFQQILETSAQKVDTSFSKQLVVVQKLFDEVSHSANQFQNITAPVQTILETVKHFAPNQAAIGTAAVALFDGVAKLAESNTTKSLEPLRQSFDLLGQIGSFTGNRALVQQIGVAGSAAISLLEGLSGENTALSIAENVLGLATMIAPIAPYAMIGVAAFTLFKSLGLFGGGSSSSGSYQLMDFIRKEIGRYAEQINKRLNIIDAKLDTLYKIAIATFKELAEVKNDVRNVQYSVDLLRHQIEKFANETRINLLDQAKESYRKKRKLIMKRFRPLGEETAYDLFDFFWEWCTDEIKTIHILSSYRSSLSSDIDTSKKIEEIGIEYGINILAKHADFRDVHYRPLANPIEWLNGARTLIALIIKTPNFKATEGHIEAINEVIQVGQEFLAFKKFIKTNQTLFQNLCNDYRKNLYQLIRTVLKDIFTLELIKEKTQLIRNKISLVQDRISYARNDLEGIINQYPEFAPLEYGNLGYHPRQAMRASQQWQTDNLNFMADCLTAALNELNKIDKVNSSNTTIQDSINTLKDELTKLRSVDSRPRKAVHFDPCHNEVLHHGPLDVFNEVCDTILAAQKGLIALNAAEAKEEIPDLAFIKQEYLSKLDLSALANKVKRPEIQELLTKIDATRKLLIIYTAIGFRHEYKYNKKLRNYLLGYLKTENYSFEIAVTNESKDTLARNILKGIIDKSPGAELNKLINEVTTFEQELLERVSEAKDNNNDAIEIDYPAIAETLKELAEVRDVYLLKKSALLNSLPSPKLITVSETELLEACRRGDVNAVNEILKTGLRPKDALKVSARAEKLETIKILIAHGYNYFEKDERGFTILHILVKRANDRNIFLGSKEAQEIVKFLVQIDDTLLGKINAQGKTPKDLAAANVKRIIDEVLRNKVMHKFEVSGFNQAQVICVAGSFNYWLNASNGKIDLTNERINGWKMQKDQSGKWVLQKLFNPGKHEYKFVIDGQVWHPSNSANLTCDISADNNFPTRSLEL